jgi:hypothetical protein
MKGFAAVMLGLLLATCDFLNTWNLNDNRTGSGNPGGPSNVCSGLVRSVNVDSESGSQVKAGLNITFSADPRDASGNSVPADCKVGPVEATAVGECVPANAGLAVTLDAIVMNATAVGQCQAQVCFAGACGISDPVTIVP